MEFKGCNRDMKVLILSLISDFLLTFVIAEYSVLTVVLIFCSS